MSEIESHFRYNIKRKFKIAKNTHMLKSVLGYPCFFYAHLVNICISLVALIILDVHASIFYEKLQTLITRVLEDPES